MKKKLIALSLLMLLSISSISCSRTLSGPKEIRVWWGSKEEVINFLDKPEAKAERWMVQALGD